MYDMHIYYFKIHLCVKFQALSLPARYAEVV